MFAHITCSAKMSSSSSKLDRLLLLRFLDERGQQQQETCRMFGNTQHDTCLVSCAAQHPLSGLFSIRGLGLVSAADSTYTVDGTRHSSTHADRKYDDSSTDPHDIMRHNAELKRITGAAWHGMLWPGDPWRGAWHDVRVLTCRDAR